jgi:hypothetical protein
MDRTRDTRAKPVDGVRGSALNKPKAIAVKVATLRGSNSPGRMLSDPWMRFLTVVGTLATVGALIVAIIALPESESSTQPSASDSPSAPAPTITGTAGSTEPAKPSPSTPATQPSRSTDRRPVSTYLADIDPTSNGPGVLDSFNAQLSGTTYIHSVRMSCSDFGATSHVPVTWPIAGSTRLTAVVGIHDAEKDAVGAKLTVELKDQDDRPLRRPFTVSVGRPVHLDLPVKSVVAVQVVCLHEVEHHGVKLVLGDGAVTAEEP